MGSAAENLDLDTTPRDGPVSVNGVKADLLQGKINRIENLEKDKKAIAEDIKVVYQQAQGRRLGPQDHAQDHQTQSDGRKDTGRGRASDYSVPACPSE